LNNHNLKTLTTNKFKAKTLHFGWQILHYNNYNK